MYYATTFGNAILEIVRQSEMAFNSGKQIKNYWKINLSNKFIRDQFNVPLNLQV